MELEEIINNYETTLIDKNDNKWDVIETSDLAEICQEYHKQQLILNSDVKSLKDKETMALKDAYIAGYKKRALMSGLKYDEVSELNAITNFKCWKSFDLSL